MLLADPELTKESLATVNTDCGPVTVTDVDAVVLPLALVAVSVAVKLPVCVY